LEKRGKILYPKGMGVNWRKVNAWGFSERAGAGGGRPPPIKNHLSQKGGNVLELVEKKTKWPREGKTLEEARPQ